MRKIYTCISILACLSVHAQNQSGDQLSKNSGSGTQEFAQGDQLLCNKTGVGYSYPARVNVKNGWDVFATGSYLYWYSGEGGLDVATTAQFNNVTARSNPAMPKSHPIFQNFSYSSGFKVGLGVATHYDDWVIRADYTRLRQETTLHQSVPNSGSFVGTDPGFYFTNWFFQTLSQGQGPASSEFTSKWRMNLDWIDLVLERPFYSGRAFTVTPFMGLRGSLIRQTFNIDVEEVLNATPPTSVVGSNNQSHSWGIGPRLGVDGHYLVGAGVRVQGEIGGNLLFTRFTKISHSEDPFTIGGTPVAFEMLDFNCVRPMAEANLGLGWGGYFAKQRCHVDISATYDFNYLWAQNMMRVLNDLNVVGINAAANDLYLHGLTVSAAIQF